MPLRIVLATHPQGEFALPITDQYLRWGSSPRGAQTIALAAKVRALLEGRYNVSFEDVRRVVLPALRHRVILNFEAEAEGIETDHVLLDITGLLDIDEESLPGLLRAIQGARLVGSQCALIGVQPGVAQELVSLGLDLSTISTYSTLHEGVAEIARNHR